MIKRSAPYEIQMANIAPENAFLERQLNYAYNKWSVKAFSLMPIKEIEALVRESRGSSKETQTKPIINFLDRDIP